jgi:phosphate transport system substrate-binding protein
MAAAQDSRMTRLLFRCLCFWLLGAPALSLAAGPVLHGAGATFPAPVYAAWGRAYQQAAGVAVAYEPVGSGAGVARIAAGEVDFGASDARLAAAELQRLGLLQFPAVIGGVVPVVNLAGLPPGALRLDGAVLADIYLGRLHKWNDPAIAALNPGLALPNAHITVVHRSEPSGTTFLWSDFLGRTSPAWAGRFGTAAATLDWPVGVGGIGNEGVASSVQRTRWAIGYVEFAYAQAHHLAMASVRNREGRFVTAGRPAFEAAAAAAHWQQPSDLDQLLTWQPGLDSWPITGSSFVLLPANADGRCAVAAFFDWAWRHGRDSADELGYAALPEPALALVRHALPCPAGTAA